MLCSSAKISRIETGARSASLRDVRDLCVLYRVDDAERTRLMTIAREAKQQGWWNKFDDIAIDSLIGLETEATRISSHEASRVPSVFQTEEYARAVIKGVLPRIDGSCPGRTGYGAHDKTGAAAEPDWALSVVVD